MKNYICRVEETGYITQEFCTKYVETEFYGDFPISESKLKLDEYVADEHSSFPTIYTMEGGLERVGMNICFVPVSIKKARHMYDVQSSVKMMCKVKKVILEPLCKYIDSLIVETDGLNDLELCFNLRQKTILGKIVAGDELVIQGHLSNMRGRPHCIVIDKFITNREYPFNIPEKGKWYTVRYYGDLYNDSECNFCEKELFLKEGETTNDLRKKWEDFCDEEDLEEISLDMVLDSKRCVVDDEMLVRYSFFYGEHNESFIVTYFDGDRDKIIRRLWRRFNSENGGCHDSGYKLNGIEIGNDNYPIPPMDVDDGHLYRITYCPDRTHFSLPSALFRMEPGAPLSELKAKWMKYCEENLIDCRCIEYVTCDWEETYAFARPVIFNTDTRRNVTFRLFYDENEDVLERLKEQYCAENGIALESLHLHQHHQTTMDCYFNE